MKKLKATLNCIKDSETILGGEYYIVHSDYIIALEEELNRYEEIIEEPQEHKIPEKLSYILHDDDIAEIPSNEMLMNKVNEILDYLEEIE